jgi:hypothetical protein
MSKLSILMTCMCTINDPDLWQHLERARYNVQNWPTDHGVGWLVGWLVG